ncbi:hypothetical protein Tco_0886291 [Tanacetum coccineum]
MKQLYDYKNNSMKKKVGGLPGMQKQLKGYKKNLMQQKNRKWIKYIKQLRGLQRLNGRTLEQVKRYFAAQKAEAKRNKPMTQAKQRTYMSNYIKHMGSHTMQQLKRHTFDELKELFETTMKHVSTFTSIETKDKERESELAAGSSKRPRAECNTPKLGRSGIRV